jgi:hypothetical protein
MGLRHLCCAVLCCVAPASCCRLADFVLPEQLRVRGYDAGLEEEEEADLEAQFSDDEAVSGGPRDVGRRGELVGAQGWVVGCPCGARSYPAHPSTGPCPFLSCCALSRPVVPCFQLPCPALSVARRKRTAAS